MSAPVLLLDGSVSPYLPPPEVLDAAAYDHILDADVRALGRMLRERLALLHGVSVERIALVESGPARLSGLLRSLPERPIVQFAPTTFAWCDQEHSSAVVTVQRNDQFRIDAEQIGQTPAGSIALVMTPNDPTGRAIGLPAAARLARRAELLVLDERSAEMQRRSMIPLVEEFDSIVLLRSFEDWAGLGPEVPAYAITGRSIAETMDRTECLSGGGLRSALSAVSNEAKLDAIAHQVRFERNRLYRMLRKLNFLAPLPSDAGYVLAEVKRGNRELIVEQLLARGIVVHAPALPRLEYTLRFSAISPVATQRLQQALVEIARSLD